MDLALNNLQRLICHKTQQTKPNQIKLNLTTHWSNNWVSHAFILKLDVISSVWLQGKDKTLSSKSNDRKTSEKSNYCINKQETKDYLSPPPTRQDLTQGQKPEGRLKWG